MYDAFLKSVFSDRRLVEILIRDHAREWAGELDFSTLREESTQLISKKTLEQRHPDLIWSADTLDGGRVLFLLEFQRTVERLMALRTTTYAALALERIATSEEFRVGRQLPEFVYLVLYHGDRRWTAPARVVDLFERSDPGQYRLVSWGDGTGEDPSRDDLAALVLGLAPRPLGRGHGRAAVGPANRGRRLRGCGPGRVPVRDDVRDVSPDFSHEPVGGGWAGDLASRREWQGHYEAKYRAVIVGCGAERRPGRGVRGVGGSRRGERADRSLRRGEAAGVTVRGWRFLPG